MGQLVVNPDIARRIEEIARRENKTVDEALAALLDQYRPATPPDLPDSEELARRAWRKLYDKARRMWREAGDETRAALTDEQMQDDFWGFDVDGIPRLNDDPGTDVIPDGSLYKLGEALASAGFASGKTDTASRSREILRQEYADYLTQRVSDQDQKRE